RISMFPVLGSGEQAHAWKEPPRLAAASHRHDEIGALNDGILPHDSNDPSVPRFTFWDHKGSVEWVQYDFETPRRIARSAVYWFDDTGRGECRVPAAWRLLYKDGEKWQPVEIANQNEIARDRLNEVSFAPVTTSALRLEVTLQQKFSGGMFEWTVGE